MKGYQLRDAALVDYQLYELPGRPDLGASWRGPPVRSDRYLACLGAAQTFGCLCASPYPTLLGESLGMEVLNLGRGGVGPEFFLDSALLEHTNRAHLAVVQVLSARSQSNSLLELTNGIEGTAAGRPITAHEFYEAMLASGDARLPALVEETREAWIEATLRLLAAIRVPKILLWFSKRAPAYEPRYQLPVEQLWGEFPQLVDDAMIARVRPHADAYVEVVSTRGLPRQLRDRSGAPVSIVHDYDLVQGRVFETTEDSYYPSPEMHREAHDALRKVRTRL